ncbi:DinB family protein [Noviherbaspirillum aerium]|uniref:DinB family protein n=1 Tax=Noviherbaspirillum aerium TaxID=2588497 RepID=UPI00124C39A0|nr:DinB family protein [Noviherbaspirillum aerium]
MITPDYARTMAGYNRWMNGKLYASGDRLSDEQRKSDRGAFFKSLHGTLNHLLWADFMWLGRFVHGTPLEKPYPKVPVGTLLHEDWDRLKTARASLDEDIARWADSLAMEWLAADFSWYSGLTQTTRTKPAWLLVAHFFNHQTHHRGQATTLLAQFGIDPGSTDLAFMPASGPGS